MAQKRDKPKYVVTLRGVPYYKRRGYPTVRLPDLNNPDFDAAYQSVIEDVESTHLRAKPVDWADYLSERIRSVKARARNQSVPFNLTTDWLSSQVEAQDGCCAMTGIKFKLDRETHSPFAPSIDRVVPAGGYTQENCRIVCYIVNCAKNQFTDAELMKMARALVEVEKSRRKAA